MSDSESFISRPKLLALCRGATPGRMWSAEAIDALKQIGERYVGDVITSIALHDPTVRYGKVQRVYAQQVIDAVRARDSAYIAWLEEVNEAYSRALVKHGPLPKTRPAPLPSKRVERGGV